jgi:hypothetical protein
MFRFGFMARASHSDHCHVRLQLEIESTKIWLHKFHINKILVLNLWSSAKRRRSREAIALAKLARVAPTIQQWDTVERPENP